MELEKGIAWGMTREQVKAVVRRPIISETGGFIAFQGFDRMVPVNLMYTFDPDEGLFTVGRVRVLTGVFQKRGAKRFEEMRRDLVAQYGDPAKEARNGFGEGGWNVLWRMGEDAVCMNLRRHKPFNQLVLGLFRMRGDRVSEFAEKVLERPAQEVTEASVVLEGQDVPGGLGKGEVVQGQVAQG